MGSNRSNRSWNNLQAYTKHMQQKGMYANPHGAPTTPTSYTHTHTHFAYWKHQVVCIHKQGCTVLCSWGWKHTDPHCPAQHIISCTVLLTQWKRKCSACSNLDWQVYLYYWLSYVSLQKRQVGFWYQWMPSQRLAPLQRIAHLILVETVPALM